MHVDGQRATTRAMRLSVLAGVLFLGIKTMAYARTGSTSILGDAAESLVHLMAVLFAAYSLRLAGKPADQDHLYGHAKVSFFSAGFEGALIIVAAIYILVESIRAFLAGPQLADLLYGTLLTVTVMILNGALAWHLIRTGRRHRSIVLEANGHHVLTDSLTSAGALIGLLLAHLTGWLYWDTVFAILIAANIIVSGGKLIKRSIGGLMDVADPEIQDQLARLLDEETTRHGIRYHRLRHRNLGYAYAVDVHLLFPDDMPIRDAHRIATAIEKAIDRDIEPSARVFTHLEAIEDHDNIHRTSGL
jgi:cation diffusion facilitator family transporter